jgi:hypothetical protein
MSLIADAELVLAQQGTASRSDVFARRTEGYRSMSQPLEGLGH